MHWTAKRVERAQLVQSYLRGLPLILTKVPTILVRVLTKVLVRY